MALADDVRITERINVLVFSLLSFCLIAFGLWLVSAGRSYREEHAQAAEGWRVGTTRTVDITLIRDDKLNLACAWDQIREGLRCAYALDGRQVDASTANPHVLQPYNTIQNQLLLGAGLWNSADLKAPLPPERFTVSCKYSVKGLAKSASVRFASSANFTPLEQTVTVGTLTDCVIAR